MTDPRNEQAVWQVFDEIQKSWVELDNEIQARGWEKRGFTIRALYPRPADARVPEVLETIAEAFEAMQANGNAWVTTVGASALVRKHMLATPPAAKPEQGDDADADGTDLAHPAWWRGHFYTVDAVCRKVNEVLDGKDDGRGVSQEPWESTRRRLLALAAQPKPAGEAVDAEALAQSVIEELLHIPSHEAEPVAREIARRLSGQEG